MEQSQNAHSTVQAKPVSHFDPKDIQDNKIMGAISYGWILCLLPLFTKKDSAFAQEHAKQGFILFIAWIANTVIGFIPILGWIASFIGFWCLLVINIIAIVKALQGQFWEIPVIGKYRNQVKF